MASSHNSRGAALKTDLAAATPELSEKAKDSEASSSERGVAPPEEQGIWGEGGSLKDYVVSQQSTSDMKLICTTMAPNKRQRIFRYADRWSRVMYIFAMIGGVIVGAALPLMTLIFGRSTTTFSEFASGAIDAAEFRKRVDHTILWFVYLFVLRFVLGYIASLLVCVAAARTTAALRKAFLESLLRQDISHFDKKNNGAPATQVTTNGERINQGIAERLYSFTEGISLFFSAYVVALAVQWKLALITMSIVPAIVLFIGTCIALDAPIETRILKIYSRAATVAQDAFASIKTIHAFGAQDKIVDRYDTYLKEAQRHGRKKSPIYGVMFSSQQFIIMSGTALAFWEGFRLHQSGEISSVGTVFTVVLSVTLGATSVLIILPQAAAVTNASSAAAELFSIMDNASGSKTSDPLTGDGAKPAHCTGHIEIDDLHFAYPARPTAQVMQGLNLSIPAGKSTAIVGPSGSGKSTLVGLLERWYEPTSGYIRLDGQDLATYNPKWLRTHMRLVQQEPTLFRGTVYDNVAKGFTDDQMALPAEVQSSLISQACVDANADEFIARLPNGYHTQVGERANTLSGGQRQRLAIARAIVSDPKILLLDEATSALDPRAEQVVQEALDRVSHNKTTLVIAHKLATIKAADNIAVMIQGKVLEQGTHTELIERDGLYAAMVRAQDLGTDADEESSIDAGLPSGLDNREVSDEKDDGPILKDSPRRTEAIGRLSAGTLNYSLIKCVVLLLSEHPDLYLWYAVIAFACVLAGGSYPAQAIIFSRLISTFIGEQAGTHQANFYALLFFVLALVNLVALFLVGAASNTIGQALTARYRREMLQRMIYLDQDFFDQPENSSGAITSKLSSVPSALQELMSSNLGLIINVLVNIIASSAVGIAFGYKLGLVIVFGGLTVIVGAGYTRIRLDQKIEAIAGELFTESAALATEAVTSIRTVRHLTLEGDFLRRYNEIVDGITAKVVKNFLLVLVPYAFSQSADYLVMALGFWYGSRLLSNGEYTTTQFFVIFISVLFGGQATTQYFSYTSSLTKAGGSANYIFWLRTLQPLIRETSANRELGPSTGPIEMNKLGFQYKQRDSTPVLQGISLQIKHGATVAFCGASGCGKSTLINLLERFYDPTTGCIKLDGQEVATVSPFLYRKYMSLVQQEPPLYLGSVRENIALGLDKEPTDEDVEQACRQANVLEFVSSLPEGLQTDCGARGMQFSGGQRQRIAVARALIRKPRLLLLDEATSALDSSSERLVQQALDEAASAEGFTTIAVAHRLSTIKRADIIFVISDGRIAEAGTHEQLQQFRGKYYAMCLAQALDQA